jgi:hypothetical protein
MDLDTFLIAVLCWIDEAIPRVTNGQRLRERGPEPPLADSEVLTMEVVGDYLGVVQDSALFAYFRQHYAHFFPALRHLHRTTYVRQAATLWRLKERLWQDALSSVPHDEHCAISDSFPVPVCHFARAHHCRRFRAEAAYGKDTLVRQTFYGVRVHMRVEWPGVITRFDLAAARRRAAGSLPHGQARSPPTLECAAQSRPLPHRHRLWPTGRSLHCQAAVGAGPVASLQPHVAQRVDAYARDSVER